MGFKDFLGQKKQKLQGKMHESYENYKEQQHEKELLGKIRHANERATYRTESRERAREEGIMRGREKAHQPSMRDRIVGGLMNSGGGSGGGKFLDVNAENPRTSESHLSSGFEGSFFGKERKSGKSPIESAMFGGDGGFGGSALSKAFNFGSTPRRHHKKRR